MVAARQAAHDVREVGAEGNGDRPTLRAVEAPPSLAEQIGAIASGVGTRVSRTITTGPLRPVLRFLDHRAVVRASMALPRTARFITSALTTGQVAATVPAPRMSVGFAAQAALDEALLAMALTPRRMPKRADYLHVAHELGEARRLYAREGWLDRPRSYHRKPPALMDGTLTTSSHWSFDAKDCRYERIAYESGYEPRAEEPGAERWAGYEPNRTAYVNIFRHDDEPRPWVIAVHGFCMGSPTTDVRSLHVRRLFSDLGMNVAMPVLPLHGPRKVTRVSGEPLLSFQFMNAVHGLSQAAWDIRRLIGWVRRQGATSVSLYGVSLGGYTVSLLAGLEKGLDGVVAGIPVSDFPGLFHRHSPARLVERGIEHRILDGTVHSVFTVVSPFSFAPLVPYERRFIYAGYADRLALPDQAQRLWEHWDEPSISWYAGNHVGYIWSKQVADFVASSLSVTAGLPGAREAAAAQAAEAEVRRTGRRALPSGRGARVGVGR